MSTPSLSLSLFTVASSPLLLFLPLLPLSLVLSLLPLLFPLILPPFSSPFSSSTCAQSDTSVYLHWLDLELGDPVGNEEGVLQCFTAVEGSALPAEAKTDFKQRKLQYMQEFGSTLEK